MINVVDGTIKFFNLFEIKSNIHNTIPQCSQYSLWHEYSKAPLFMNIRATVTVSTWDEDHSDYKIESSSMFLNGYNSKRSGL